MRALNISATGMEAQSQNLSTIANNIANTNTIGFKKKRTEFEDLLYQTTNEAGGRSSSDTIYNVGTQLGSGTKVSATRSIEEQGTPKLTSNPFDLMINGDGYFGIILPNNEIKYSRDGSFSLNKEGVLVNSNGYSVFPTITFPPNTTSVTISNNGTVEAFVNNQPEPQNLGIIPVFTFINPTGLKSIGKNLLSQTVASGPPVQGVASQEHVGEIQQGALENSNVSIMNEMTDMIKAQRTYEMNAKVMGVADKIMEVTNNIR